MYNIGDKVIHQCEGACYIKDIVDLNQNDSIKQYYILEPLLNKKANVYISTDEDKQRRIRSAIDITELKKSENIVFDTKINWIDDAKKRYTEYNKFISSFDFLDVMLLIKSLLTKKTTHALTTTDQNLLTAAQRLVYSEMAIVLNQDYDMVAAKVEQYFTPEPVEV